MSHTATFPMIKAMGLVDSMRKDISFIMDKMNNTAAVNRTAPSI